MSTEPLRIGIIGAGLMALLGRVPLLRATGRAEVTALCRRDPDKLRVAQQFRGVPKGYTDWREMLDKEPLDAVTVTTPHDLHYEQTMAALERGLHVLVDKPIALSGAQAWEVVRAAERAGCVVMHHIGLGRKGPPRRAVEVIQEGAIGALRQISVAYSRKYLFMWQGSEAAQQEALNAFLLPVWEHAKAPEELRHDWAMSGDWHHAPTRSGGGLLANTGLHTLDAALRLGGAAPVEVVALAENAGLDAECIVSISARLANGVLLTIASVDTNLFTETGRWMIYGDEGLVTFGQGEEAKLVRAQGSETLQDQSPSAALESAFVASILDGAPNPSPARQGAILASFVDAVYRSIREKRIVQVELPADA